MKLTIKAIMRWEMLRQKAFGTLDYNNEDDVDTILYVMNEEKTDVTFSVFRRTLKSKRLYEKMVKEFVHEMAMMSQYITEEKEEGKKKAKPERITKLIGYLVMEGLDATYATEKMRLCDLTVYLDALARRKQEAMESDRFWTYFQLMPHVQKKCLKDGPQGLVKFAWEQEEEERNRKEIKDVDIQMFERFMEKGKTMFR